VMQPQEHILRPQSGYSGQSVRLEFLVLRDVTVTQMKGAKLSKRDKDADGLRVFGIVVARLETGAI